MDREDIYKFLEEILRKNCLSFNDVRQEVSKNYDVQLMQSDISVIEELFGDIYLKLWEEECKKIIEKIVQSNNVGSIKSLVLEFNGLRDFITVPTMLKTNRYSLILKEQTCFNENSVVNVLNNLKTFMNYEIEEIKKNEKNEKKFISTFCNLMRSSDKEYLNLINSLKLREYINREISLNKVLDLIINKKFNMNHYDELQSLSSTLLKNTSFLIEDEIYSQIQPYVEPVKTTFDDESGIFEVSGKIIFLQNVLCPFFKTLQSVKEIHIFCEVFHIHMIGLERTFYFDVDNLIIKADIIKVHNEVTFDLSGKDGEEPATTTKAGRNSEGQGINGRDGFAGESGGNVSINCSSFVNSHLLSIQSNGGNGSNGQDGGDGVDGINGRGVKESDFMFEGSKFEQTLFNSVPFNGKRVYEKDGIKIHYVIQYGYANSYRFMLCKGANGTQGKLGGYFGLGGEGGAAGDIQISCNDSPNNLNIMACSGKQGQDGTAGYSGITGKDGRDAWAYDHCYTSSTFVGLNEFCKYDLGRSKTSVDYSAWCCDDAEFIYAKKVETIKSVSSVREKNDKVARKLRALHAKASIKQKSSSKVLENSYLKNFNSNQSSKYSDIHMDENLIDDQENVEITTTYKSATSHQQVSVKMDSFNPANLNLEEVKAKIIDYDFLNTIEKCDLTTKDYEELKKFIKKTEITNQKLNKRDVEFALNQKIVLNNLKKFIKDHKVKKNFSYKDIPKDIEKEIPYLNDSEEFDCKIKSFNHELNHVPIHDYFNVNNDDIRTIIQKSFTKTINNYSEGKFYNNWGYKSTQKIEPVSQQVKSLLLGIIEILFKFKHDIPELKNTLNPLEDEYEESIKPFFNEEVLSAENIIEIEKNLKKFYGNKTITKFIENNLISRGIFSPIYKKIVAFAFNVNIKIFYQNLDGNLCCIGHFNAKEKFDSMIDSVEDKPVDLNLLNTENNFTILNFDEQKYLRDHLRESITTHKTEKINKLINKITTDERIFVESIFDRFPLLTDEEISQINLMMSNIELSGGILIIESINIVLKYEENQMSFEEFHLILLMILEMICENSRMVEYFKTKFLGLKHTEWIVDIILLRLEDYLNINDNEILKEWRQILLSLSCRKILVLFLKEIEKLEENKLAKNDFDAIFKNMKFFSLRNYKDLVQFNDLNSWKHVITTQYWLDNFKFLELKDGLIINELLSKYSSSHIEKLFTKMQFKSSSIEKFKLDVNEFLKNFNTGEWIFCDKLFDIIQHKKVEEWNQTISSMYKVEGGQRSIEQITKLIKENNETSETIKDNAENISSLANQLKMRISEVENLNEENIKSEIKKVSESSNLDCIIDKLMLISQVFKLKTGNELRNTQIISLLTLWESQNSSLLQVSTGEGKTFIGVGLAILKFFNKEKVHIVTSSNVLAERDATDKINWEIFEFFGIKVGHNCSDSSEERRRVYEECDVVYGSLGNFQRDYLLTEFFDKNLIDTENLQNVIVDEVDSILLDRGNNILYLSQELPAVDELQSLFIFIWSYVNQQTDDFKAKQEILKPEKMRATVLDNWLGRIDEVSISRIIIDDPEVKIEDVIKMLQTSGFINSNLLFCPKKSKTITENSLKASLGSLKLSDESLDEIIYYIQNILNYPKSIKFPSYLNKFVMNHLDKWISSAITAICMEDGREYVIDRVQTRNTKDLDPNIIIMDVETGTDLKSSEWDEGLCQFLQLKHGCKLSLYSLKSIFISNVSYFKLYNKLYGMTGTLGSNYERKKLTAFYDLHYVTIPTFLPKKFNEFKAILTNSSETWINKVMEVTKAMFKIERSVLIICNTIKDIQMFKSAFDISEYFRNIKIKIYQRDYESFDLNNLGSKELIIATNLAGRGTDIKLSKELEEKGGLHVILTYLASNIRIESQAFGRASRAGAKGSACLIISNMGDETIQELKIERDNAEITRLDSVATYYNNFISSEEDLFSLFMKAYKSFSSKISDKNVKKILLDNLKIMWTFWLDENSERIKDFKMERNETHKDFEEFIAKVTNVEYANNYLHPMTRLELARYYDRKNDFETAKMILQIKFNKGVLVQKDWDALNYMSNYIILKEKPENIEYVHRSLKTQEIKGLKNTIQIFYRRENEESARETVIKAYKERKTLFEIKGFENNNKNIGKIRNDLTESLKKFLGTGITPESFNFMSFGNRFSNEKFYNDLILKGYITKPSIALDFDKSDVDLIAKNYGLDAKKLNKFLDDRKGNFIDSLDEFADEIARDLNFPSCEVFWKMLVENRLLVNNIDYAIIDYKTIKDFNPKTADKIYKACEKFIIKEFKVENNAEIFLYNVDDDNELIKNFETFPQKIAVDLTLMDEWYHVKTLIPPCCIKINSKAEFDIERFQKFNSNFKKLDSIRKQDLKFIKSDSVRENVLQILIDQGILSKSTENSSIYRLNFRKLDKLNISKHFIYEDELFDILELNFKYRFALESLAENIKENIAKNVSSQNESIKLESNPQLMILHEFIENFIIQPSKVNQEKIKYLKKDDTFKDRMTYQEMLNYFEEYLPENVDCNELFEELLSKNESFHKDLGCYVQVKLSPKFKDVESDVQELLDRKRIFIENKEKIIKTLKDGVDLLNNNSFAVPCPVLVHLKTLNPEIDDDLLNHMKLMGLDYIIQIKDQTYTSIYFKNISYVVGLGLIQFAVAYMLTNEYAICNLLMKGGFSDIINALSTLAFGSFNWKHYKTQRLKSILEDVFAMIKSNTFSSTKQRFFQKWYNKSKTNDQVSQQQEPKLTVSHFLNKGKDAGLVLFDRLLGKALELLERTISSKCTDSIKETFSDHDVSSTINHLLKDKSEDDVMKLIIKYVTNILNDNSSSSSILSKTLNYVRTEMNSGADANQNMVLGISKANQAITSTVICFQVKQILSKLNERLEKHINFASDSEKKDNKEFKSKVLQEIITKVSLSLKKSINQNISTPLLNYSANKSIKKATAGSMWKLKNKTASNDMRQAAKLQKKCEQAMNTPVSNIDYSKNIRQNLLMLKRTSKDPNVLANLSKLDLPVTHVELEAAAQLFEVTLVVSYNNIEHRFGVDWHEVIFNYNDGHFENSNDNQENPSMEFFYRCLKEKIDKPFTLEEFKEKIAKDILYNPLTKQTIENCTHSIGFYENIKISLQFQRTGDNNFYIKSDKIKIQQSSTPCDDLLGMEVIEDLNLDVPIKLSKPNDEEQKYDVSQELMSKNEHAPNIAEVQEEDIADLSTITPTSPISTQHNEETPPSLKVAVVFKDYPKDFLNPTQAKNIENYIMADESFSNLSFSSFEHIEGMLRIECTNQETAERLKQKMANFKVDGKSLTSYEGDAIPKLPSFNVFISGKPISFEHFKILVENQNASLNPQFWFLTEKIESKAGQTFLFKVDCDSAIKIKEVNFQIRIGTKTYILNKDDEDDVEAIADLVVERLAEMELN